MIFAHQMGPVRPMSEQDAVHAEATARSERIMAKRARSLESKQIHLRDADAWDDFAGRIRRVLRNQEPSAKN